MLSAAHQEPVGTVLTVPPGGLCLSFPSLWLSKEQPSSCHSLGGIEVLPPCSEPRPGRDGRLDGADPS